MNINIFLCLKKLIVIKYNTYTICFYEQYIKQGDRKINIIIVRIFHVIMSYSNLYRITSAVLNYCLH